MGLGESAGEERNAVPKCRADSPVAEGFGND
jgi:hypothetical protein